MALLKFNKSELVNLGYSLKREILCANKTGAYCNTSIVACNTRRYHGLLAVTLDRFGGDKYLLLSGIDESIVMNGKQFNLGIHCYGDVYEPRGHKYVVDFEASPVPRITCKVGDILFRKSIVLAPYKDQVLVKFELLSSPFPVRLLLKPFLAFRNVHDLTHRNSEACTEGKPVMNGVSYRMYKNFPDLHMQLNTSKARFLSDPDWNMSVTYSDEYRRGFDCREDLFMPGQFEVSLNSGESVVFSASLHEEKPSMLVRNFNSYCRLAGKVNTNIEHLRHCADLLITDHNGRKKINAGFSWLSTGLLRESLQALPGLTLYGLRDPHTFEEILDNLIADEQERLFHRTTQVEAPLYMVCSLLSYIEFGADERHVWEKYGPVVKGIVESYLPGVRKEVTMHPNGLLWAQMDGVALSWMNAYVDGRPVTERAGYQVETNSFWYNAICFMLEMESRYGAADHDFMSRWSGIRDLVKSNFQKVFWNDERMCLADYVDNSGQHMEIRPNQLLAIWVKYSPVDEELSPMILKVIDNELITARGIRTLSPRDPAYKGVYEGSQRDRDLSYHQGCTRPFLLAQYIRTCFRVKGMSFYKRAQWLVEGFYEDLAKHGVGAFSELYDGDPPHEPHGAISSASNTSALLAVNYFLEKYGEDQK